MMGENKFPYQDQDLDIESRIDDLLCRMTLEEKVAQLGSVVPRELLEDGEFSLEKADHALKNGVGQVSRIAGFGGLEPADVARAANQVQRYLKENTRLGIPAILHEECLSGYMGKRGTTFPQAIGLASSWDPSLIEEITTEIRKQLKAIGAHHALSPVLDVARDLRWGRVEETFGEDPYLTAKMGVSYVKGLQGNDPKTGIIATLKHFAGHSNSEGGRNHAPVNISSRTLRETYLFPFEAAVREARAGSVMNAYHDIDGVPCAASRKLLTDILRGEWGFDGIVVSDYCSIRMLHTEHLVADSLQQAGVMALEAGLDIELHFTECYGERLVEAVRGGMITERTVDESVRRHLRAKFRLGLFEDPFVEESDVGAVFETPAQRALAREAARQSIVLLKNEGHLLPLSTNGKKIALIGPSAHSTRNLLGDYAYSAHVESPEDAVDVVSILDGVRKRVGDQCEVVYAEGCTVMGDSEQGFAQAVQTAKEADVAVVVIGGKSGLSSSDSEKAPINTTGEGHDRTDLRLPGVQQKLVEAIYQTGTPMVVVLINGRPLAVEWIAHHVPAVVEAWLPGEEGGSAVADVLFGDYNPSGRLPVSIPKHVGQLPVHYNRKNVSMKRRYVDSDSQPLYPFGYGLSYTTFTYDNLTLNTEQMTGSGKIQIGVTVKNVGDRGGHEVVQLYVRDLIASLTRPVKELKGFQRIWLEPGEAKTLTFTLTGDQLAFYDKDMNFVVEPGTFEVQVGSSSEDIHLRGTFDVVGERKIVSLSRTYFSTVEEN